MDQCVPKGNLGTRETKRCQTRETLLAAIAQRGYFDAKSMLAEIYKHLEATPFQPFAVRTADGREYLVPTEDHIYLPPGAKRVVISDDEGITVAIPALFITGFVQGTPSSEKGSATQQP